ncbi:MAG: sulfatase-like hydrolase/transferase [Acidobacteria bacterium]|nr:sulfatase-like hydrolase/transferase [Acidobacteriota bacterium]
MQKIWKENRFAALLLFAAIFLIVSFLTRVFLLGISFHRLDLTVGRFLGIFGIGFFFDIVTLIYFCIPFTLFLMLVPDKLLKTAVLRWFVLFCFAFFTYVILFNAAAEYFFFEEFGVRFNFIAVDYLVYTREVVKNIVESYPMTPLLLTILVISVSITLALKKYIFTAISTPGTWKKRLTSGFLILALSGLSFLFVEQDWSHFSTNNYDNTLAENGIYDFFAAFRDNSLNYDAFYPTIRKKVLFPRLRNLLKEPDGTYVSTNPANITQKLTEEGPEKHKNLVFIVEESLSGSFMAHFGNKDNLTPRFDELAEKSMFFTRLYATGTRTTRGLEAVTLSLPPTPGRSIIKRPHNENLFSIATVLKPRGYDMMFLYGGYGYFDNMNYFYTHNGFRKIDRSDLTDKEITFENAWGVCDEDMFNRCLKEFDKTSARGNPFCAVIMTTSNHRPYTYPAGKIDIPSHTGRKGAVKYADYATGKFLDDAQNHPWFKNTVFVIVADHCASSMGKRALPVNRYHIPLFIYSPGFIKPQKITTQCSQMDITPTVLDLLDISYDSQFFGQDILAMKPATGRALIATYSRMGYLKGNKLVILDVKKEFGMYLINNKTFTPTRIQPDRQLLENAISYYQGAAELEKKRGLN